MNFKDFFLGLMFIQINFSSLVFAQYFGSPSSKYVHSGSGSGMHDSIERVSPCLDQVYSAYDEGHFITEHKECHKACATVTFRNFSEFIIYDDDGKPLFGTETQKIVRQAEKICGITSCDGDDIISSCEAEIKPYLEVCLANGFCQNIDGKMTRNHRSKNKNPYYLNTNPLDLE